jgi:hypothetical protein
VVLLTAKRYPAGSLALPSEVRLDHAAICRLSGLLASPECPSVTEYFVPGTIPHATCDWHVDGAVRLPPMYAEWAAAFGEPIAPPASPAPRPLRAPGGRSALTISSPQDGDRFRLPPGVDRRFATIALRASGVDDPTKVRWYVDGVRVRGGRWVPAPGRHQIRVESGTEGAVATITVED